jgi:hypothetical protein
MNQNMHTWIATLLVILTIKIFFPQYQFHKLKIEDEDKSIMFIVNWVAPFISFSIWLYLIS